MMSQWWNDARIDATVTREFVCQQLLPDEIRRLDSPVSFGDGLTNDTYWDWIENKCKRLFLILVDLDLPDQIFPVIDESWCDDELPLAPEIVESLCLTPQRDEKVDKKFYQRQFAYLVDFLEKGDHRGYDDFELVPADVVDKKPGLSNNSSAVERVTLPNHPDRIFWRRRIRLDELPGGTMSQSEFEDVVESLHTLENDHIASYWASYIHQGHAYLLFTPANDSNLRSFLTTRPACYKALSKTKRKELVMNWILCLADTLAFLHSKNRSHCHIKPSNILLNQKNHVFFSNPSRFGPEPPSGQSSKNSFDREGYDYAAPEQWFRPTSGPTSPPARKAALSSSPEYGNIIILRSEFHSCSPNAMLHSPNPQLNPQAADVFSLGCLMLDLISFLLKKHGKFASHRAAKHKMPGRGGAVLDSSFHKNLGQVESWMTELAKEANKKVNDRDGGAMFRGITPMLHVVARMLSAHPHDRPSAQEVQQKMYRILTETCTITEPHCVHQYPTLQYSFSQLRMDSGSFVTTDGVPIRHGRQSGSFSPRMVMRHASTHSSSSSSAHSGDVLGANKDREMPLSEYGQSRTPRNPGDKAASTASWQTAPTFLNNADRTPVF